MAITMKIISGWDDSTVLVDLNDVTAPDSSGIMLRPGWVPRISSPAPQQLGTRFPWTNETEQIPLTVWGTSTSDVWQNIQELNGAMDLARLHWQGNREGFINFYYKPHGTSISGVTCALILPQLKAAVQWDQQIHRSSRAYYAEIWLTLPREGIYMLNGDAPLAANQGTMLAGTAEGTIAWTTNPKTASNYQVPAPVRIRLRGFTPLGGFETMSVGQGYFIWTANDAGIHIIESGDWDVFEASSGEDGVILDYTHGGLYYANPTGTVVRITSPADDAGFEMKPPIYFMDHDLPAAFYNTHRLAVFIHYAVDPDGTTGKTTAFRAWAGTGRTGGVDLATRFPDLTPARILTVDQYGDFTGVGYNKVAFLGILKPRKAQRLRIAVQKLVPENAGEVWIIRAVVMALPDDESFGWVRNIRAFLDYSGVTGNNDLDIWFDPRFEEGEYPQAFVTASGSNPSDLTQGDRDFPDFYLPTQGRVAPMVGDADLKCMWIGGHEAAFVPLDDNNPTMVQVTLQVDAETPEGAFLVVP